MIGLSLHTLVDSPPLTNAPGVRTNIFSLHNNQFHPRSNPHCILPWMWASCHGHTCNLSWSHLQLVTFLQGTFFPLPPWWASLLLLWHPVQKRCAARNAFCQIRCMYRLRKPNTQLFSQNNTYLLHPHQTTGSSGLLLYSTLFSRLDFALHSCISSPSMTDISFSSSMSKRASANWLTAGFLTWGLSWTKLYPCEHFSWVTTCFRLSMIDRRKLVSLSRSIFSSAHLHWTYHLSSTDLFMYLLL